MMVWGYLQDALFGMGLFSYALGLAGSAWGLFKTVAGPHVWPLVRDRFITSYESHYTSEFGGTKAFRWLGEHVKTRRRIRFDGTWVPGEGWYTFKHSGVRFGLRVFSVKEHEGIGLFVIIYTFKNRKWFENWLQQLAKERRKPSAKAPMVSIRVLTPSGSIYLGQKRARSPKSLVFEGDLHQKIAKEAQAFVQDEQYYVDRGIPWTLGYLLHGPPGTGKSSIPFFLAGMLHKDIMIIPAKLLKLPSFSQTFLRAWEQDYICLFDDIDGILGRRPGQAETSSQETLHELLGLLDSPLSPHGFIFFMTTNFPETLDEAMIRPGRIDRKYYVGAPKPPEVKRLFHFFYPDADGDAFLKVYGNRTCSPAMLSAFFSRYRDVKVILESMDKLDALANKPRASFDVPAEEKDCAEVDILFERLALACTAGEDLKETVEAIAAEFGERENEVLGKLLALAEQPQFQKDMKARAEGAEVDVQVFKAYLVTQVLEFVPDPFDNIVKCESMTKEATKCVEEEEEAPLEGWDTTEECGEKDSKEWADKSAENIDLPDEFENEDV